MMSKSESDDGALMSTLFAPASRCSAACARLRKMPVDSITTSTPASAQGISLGSLRAVARTLVPSTIRLSSSNSTVPANGP